ncbi:MAG: UDP-N-acetylmuramate dehydrogenase [Patescibacteria group bacterium]
MFQKIKVQENVPLKEHTTIKIGGPAKYFLRALSEDELSAALSEAKQNNIKTLVLGGGSNIIFSDDGFDGLVIKNEIKNIKSGGLWITAGAGINLNELVAAATENELSGLEFLAGIPGTVGGAIWMNAGGNKEAIGNFVKEVYFLDHEFKPQKYSQAECEFRYRHSKFQEMVYIITGAKFELEKNSQDRIQKIVEEKIREKQINQDLNHPSAGCIFKNPEGEKSAAQLIEDLDLKGMKMGDIQISPIHANYLINKGNASSDDVIMMISLIKQKVRTNFNIQLQEEVQLIGL